MTELQSNAEVKRPKSLAELLKNSTNQTTIRYISMTADAPTQTSTEPDIGREAELTSQSKNAMSDPSADVGQQKQRVSLQPTATDGPSPRIITGPMPSQTLTMPQMDYPESTNPLAITNQPITKLVAKQEAGESE